MTIKELKPLLEEVRKQELQTTMLLNGDNNPQVKEMHTASKAKLELVNDILDAINGRPIYLKMSIKRNP
jgi:hypothetical protein